MEIELPDGTILDAPDGADPSMVAKNYIAKRNAAPQTMPSGRQMTREQMQSELDAYNQQQDSIGGKASDFALRYGGDALRQVGRLGKNIVQGTMALPAMALDYPSTLFNFAASKAGSTSRAPTPFTDAVSGLGGQELAPRGRAERFVDRATQGAAGVLTGTGIGGALAGSATPVASRIGLSLMERPLTQLVSGASGGLSAQAAQESGFGPLGQVAAGMLGGLAGAAVTGGIKQPIPASSEDLSPDAQVAMARDAGYKLTPRTAGGKVGAVAEGLSNSAKLERTLSSKNQQVTNRLARQELGIGGDGPIAPQMLDGLRNKYNAVYKAIAGTGEIQADQQFAKDMFSIGNRTAQLARDFPDSVSPAIEKLRNSYLSPKFDAESAVQAVRQLRADASKYLKTFDDPEKVALGMASRQIADALDSQLQRHVEQIGKEGLAQSYRNARTQLAKIHTVDDALNAESGNINALALGKALDHGAPLSGKLLTIAQMARRFPKVVQATEKLPNAGFEFVDPALGAGGAGAAALVGANPIVGASVMLARPGMRQALASDAYQNLLGQSGRDNRNLLLRSGAVGAASTANKDKKK